MSSTGGRTGPRSLAASVLMLGLLLGAGGGPAEASAGAGTQSPVRAEKPAADRDRKPVGYRNYKRNWAGRTSTTLSLARLVNAPRAVWTRRSTRT